jgi:hypothetical protein
MIVTLHAQMPKWTQPTMISRLVQLNALGLRHATPLCVADYEPRASSPAPMAREHPGEDVNSMWTMAGTCSEGFRTRHTSDTVESYTRSPANMILPHQFTQHLVKTTNTRPQRAGQNSRGVEATG